MTTNFMGGLRRRNNELNELTNFLGGEGLPEKFWWMDLELVMSEISYFVTDSIWRRMVL